MVTNSISYLQYRYYPTNTYETNTFLKLNIGIIIPTLFFREPYATLIIEGKKDIGLRNWKPPTWVKEFYIHVPVIADKGLCKEHNIIPQSPKTIIGKARISEVKHYNSIDEFTKDYPRHHCKSWKYNYGLILDKVKKVEPHIEYIPGKRFFFFIR